MTTFFARVTDDHDVIAITQSLAQESCLTKLIGHRPKSVVGWFKHIFWARPLFYAYRT